MTPAVVAQLGGALADRDPAGADASLAAALAAATAGALAALAEEGVPVAEISLTLLDDAAMAELNREWLGHEGSTDVLSFPLWEEGDAPTGDVYIGYERAVHQAAENGCAVDEEVTRLAVHGTLHVLGWDHPAGEERTGSEMWRLQERIVARARST